MCICLDFVKKSIRNSYILLLSDSVYSCEKFSYDFGLISNLPGVLVTMACVTQLPS